MALLWLFIGRVQNGENFDLSDCMFPVKVEQGHVLPSYCNSHTVKKGLFIVTFFTFLCFLLMFCYLKLPLSIVLKSSIVSSIPQHKRL